MQVQPPQHLSATSKREWRAIGKDFTLDSAVIGILTVYFEARERRDQVRAEIAKDKLVKDGRPHPLLAVERDMGNLMARMWRLAGFDQARGDDATH